jgi:carboxylesterase
MKPHDAAYFDHECCRPFLHEGGETGVLLLHGFSGSVSHVRPLGDALADRGYTVMGVNLPGHATTEREMAKTGWKDWLTASRDAMEELRTLCSTAVVAGLSMGGVLSLILAEEKRADGCVTLSAPMAAQNRLIYFSGILSIFKPRISWKSSSERARQLDVAFDYGYSGFPSRKAGDLNRLISTARRDLAHASCPLLTVQSDDDDAIWPGSADCILSGVSSQNKRNLALKGVPHVCTLSRELPAIVDAMDQFLKTL